MREAECFSPKLGTVKDVHSPFLLNKVLEVLASAKHQETKSTDWKGRNKVPLLLDDMINYTENSRIWKKNILELQASLPRWGQKKNQLYFYTLIMHNWKQNYKSSIISIDQTFKKKEKHICLTFHVQDWYARSQNGDERNQRPTEVEKDTIFVNWGLNMSSMSILQNFVSDKREAKYYWKQIHNIQLWQKM